MYAACARDGELYCRAAVMNEDYGQLVGYAQGNCTGSDCTNPNCASAVGAVSDCAHVYIDYNVCICMHMWRKYNDYKWPT